MMALEFRIGDQSIIDHIAVSVSQGPIDVDRPALIVFTQHQRGSAVDRLYKKSL